MPLLEAKNIHKTYYQGLKPLEVLRGVDFSCNAGEKIAIAGASGAGKSTLLHILGTLDRPTQGELFFQGQKFEQNENKLARFRNENLGFIFQFHHLLPLFTALENVMMPVLIAGESKKKAEIQAKEILIEVGLQERFFHKPSELSGGEQQRVAIARALIRRPKIIMADEPTGNLDTQNSWKIFELLLGLNEKYQASLILVTHNEDIAKEFKRRLWMKDGKIV